MSKIYYYWGGSKKNYALNVQTGQPLLAVTQFVIDGGPRWIVMPMGHDIDKVDESFDVVREYCDKFLEGLGYVKVDPKLKNLI